MTLAKNTPTPAGEPGAHSCSCGCKNAQEADTPKHCCGNGCKAENATTLSSAATTPRTLRTWHYLLPPSRFELSGCPCGNKETQWSEYQKHLWCSKCQKDFIPEHGGVFDGPIPIRTAALMGVVFDRYNMTTKQVERFDIARLVYVDEAGRVVEDWNEENSRPPMMHTLKTDPKVFQDVKAGRKTFELRKADRDFRVGDTLHLLETRSTGAEMAAGAPLEFTGEEHKALVLGILHGPIYGLAEGWCILSIPQVTA